MSSRKDFSAPKCWLNDILSDGSPSLWFIMTGFFTLKSALARFTLSCLKGRSKRTPQQSDTSHFVPKNKVTEACMQKDGPDISIFCTTDAFNKTQLCWCSTSISQWRISNPAGDMKSWHTIWQTAKHVQTDRPFPREHTVIFLTVN